MLPLAAAWYGSARAIDMLETMYWGNPLGSYLVAAGVLVAILFAVRIIRYLVVKRLGELARRSPTHLDDAAVGMARATKTLLVFFIALHAASLFLVLPRELAAKTKTAAVIALLIQIGVWSSAAVGATIRRLREKKLAEGDTSGIGILSMVSFFGRVVAWVIISLLILDNLGVDVTALVAGLGVGGIALALAVQNILQDVFASVSIMLDRPFEIGDTINIDQYTGTVLNVGIKTTRMRSLNGEELVFANADLLKSRIRNFRRLQERRVLFTLGVSYDTPLDVLEKLSGLLRDIVQREENVRFDRAHLKGLGPSSLDFEIVYFVTVPEYVTFMDIQQRIQLEILRRLLELGVSIPFPTQTLHIASLPAGPDGERAAGAAALNAASSPAAQGGSLRGA